MCAPWYILFLWCSELSRGWKVFFRLWFHFSLRSYLSSRQKNMDYSSLNGIAHSDIGNIDKIIIYYDVNCQYCVNFENWLKASWDYLPYPTGKTTYFGIGAFHISGHIPHCFPCHAPYFIPGASVIDGEVLETLWSTLNQVSPSAQVASLPSRSEMLDDHMLNSNWNKLLNIGKVLDCPTCLAN